MSDRARPRRQYGSGNVHRVCDVLLVLAIIILLVLLVTGGLPL